MSPAAGGGSRGQQLARIAAWPPYFAGFRGSVCLLLGRAGLAGDLGDDHVGDAFGAGGQGYVLLTHCDADLAGDDIG